MPTSNQSHSEYSLKKNTPAKNEQRLRSATDVGPSYEREEKDQEVDAPYRSRLYQLFGLIEKEFDALYAENCELNAKIAALTEKFGDSVVSSVPVSEIVQNNSEIVALKGSGKKAMQMGLKLRTALRGPPGRLVFKVGGADGRNFRMTSRFTGHRDGVWHVSANEVAKVVASASADQTARVFSLDTGVCLGTYVGHTGSVNSVSLCPTSIQTDTLIYCSASGDESAHIWKIPANTEAKPVHHTSSEDENADLIEKEEGDNTETNDNEPQNAEGAKIRNPQIRLTGHTGAVVSCDWLAGGHQLLTASWDRTANVYDAERGEILNILSGHEQELTHCSAHSSQKLVVTSSKDYTFRLWDFRESIQSVAVFQGHNDSVSCVSFSSGDRLVSGSDDRTVKVWDLRNMRSALTTIRLTSSVNRLAVSQVHSVVAIPHDNRHVRIYDLNGVRIPRVPNRRCHHRIVSGVAWADDHPTTNLITCGFDGQVIGWKVALGKESKEAKE